MAILPFRRSNLAPSLFPDGVVRESELTRARMEQAAELRSRFTSAAYTGESLGPLASNDGVNPDDLMPDPDEVIALVGRGDDKIYDEMAGNVLSYGALVEGRIDVATSLTMTWLAGMKGDPESESAREEIESTFDAMSESNVSIRAACKAFERGFSGLENIYDVNSDNRIVIAAMIDRPRKQFGFDYRNRPWFLPHGQASNKRTRIDDYKVAFMRCGSLNTKYGIGYGPRCYPTVWAIDKTLKGFMAMTERFGYMPVVITYPNTWGDMKVRAEYARLVSQWKNVLMIPGEVDKMDFSFPTTDAAYAAANASGASRMLYVGKLETALAFFVRGSMSTSGNSDTGSFAREAVSDSAQLWKAPTDSSAIEAMMNRGYVEPLMIVNRPELPREKWPRCAIDASFGEDLRLFMELVESGARMDIPIAAVTWSERTGIPLAQEGEAVLGSPVSAAPLLPDGMAADEAVIDDTVKRMSEPASIVVKRGDGSVARYRPNQPVLTRKGVKRAALLTSADVLIDDPKRFARA